MNMTKEYNTVFCSADMYRRLVEHLHAGIYVADAEGKLVYVNQSFASMLGYFNKEELIGRDLAQQLYVHPEERVMFMEKIKKIGFVRNYEIENKRKDGTTVWFSVTSDLILDQYNELAGVEGVVYDITEQKKASKRLNILEKAVEQTADHILITDKEGMIQYVNPAFELGTGFQLADIIGRSPKILKSGNHPEDFYRQLWSTILSGHVFYARVTNQKKNGDRYVSDVTISPIVNPFGQVTHFVCTYKDAIDWIDSTKEWKAEEDAF
jgi:PAS domain S-box-containing protein